MTPEEKAQELVSKYRYPARIDGTGSSLNAAKECALIAVDEILQINSVYHDYEVYNYWDAVKIEIKKL